MFVEKIPVKKMIKRKNVNRASDEGNLFIRYQVEMHQLFHDKISIHATQ